MNTRCVAYLICLLLSVGCSEVKLPESAQQLVIDGWIETGKGPVVIVTTTVPVESVIGDEEDLKKHVVTWGKVTVSDGERDVVLTGMINDDYFPPYIYTTSSIKGEAGKTYSIKVEYSGRTATAVTTIPEAAPLKNIKVRRGKSNYEGFYITACLKDNPQTKDYYKVFIRKAGKDSTYTPSFLGLIDDEILNGNEDEIPVNNSIDNMDKKQSTLFSGDDDVFIRISSLDRAAFDYWSDFDDITMSRNPLFPVTSVIRSNINGGLGHWSGYGSSYYRVSIADSLALNRVW
jgi:hypothetical protein